MINIILNFLLFLSVFSLFLIVVYQFVLLGGYYFLKDKSISASGDQSKFIIVIPAHNEEQLIAETLTSVSKIQYPKSLYQVIVIADNCTDSTVKILKSINIDYLERNNTRQVGKGYALEHGFKHIEAQDFDAVMIIDSDTRISSNILTEFNSYLSNGFEAVQSANIVDKKQNNMFASIFALGNMIKNFYVYYPKFKFGSSAFLLGTGMCFKKSLMPKYFQKEYSISEDIEFSLRLIKENIKIAFAHKAYVETVYPDNVKAATTQRTRWTSGTFVLLKKYLPYFFVKGVRNLNLISIDTALTLFSWSKSIIGLMFCFALGLSFFINPMMHFMVWVLLIFEGVYHCFGIVLMHERGYNYKPLLKAPFLIPWFFLIAILGFFGFRKGRWNRTQR